MTKKKNKTKQKTKAIDLNKHTKTRKTKKIVLIASIIPRKYV